MKTNQILILIMVFLLFACNVGVKTDLLTGLKTSNSGLSYTDAFLASEESRLGNNEFTSGKVIHMYFDGIQGFTLRDGKVNLGASIIVTDANGSIVIEYPDLFEVYTNLGITPKETNSLDINIKINEKYFAGSKYTWKVKIWDKSSEGVITGEVEFVVK